MNRIQQCSEQRQCQILKGIIKRLLSKYSHLPDMHLLATEAVLKQAEMTASDPTR